MLEKRTVAQLRDDFDDPAIDRLATLLRTRVKRSVSVGEELASQIQQWMATNPFHVRGRIADDRLSWDLLVEFDPPPFDEWSIRFGESLHNLRSALDNLVWGLATLDGTEPQRPKALQFPIVEKAADWQSESKRISELSAAARSAIEGVQPFQRNGQDGNPENDPLLLLSRLNIVDKHRVLIRPDLNPAELSHSSSVEFRTDSEASINTPPNVSLSPDAFVNGTTLLRHVTKTPIVKVVGSYGFKGQVVVQDPVGGSVGITSVLAQFAAYVPQVLDHVLLNVTISRSYGTGSSSRA